MNSDQGTWLALLVLSFLLIIIGFQGSLGLVFAIVFSPKYVLLDTTDHSSEPGQITGAGGDF